MKESLFRVQVDACGGYASFHSRTLSSSINPARKEATKVRGAYQKDSLQYSL